MSRLWREASSRVRRMLAEDPRYFEVALIVLALGLGVHAGLFQAINGSRLSPGPQATADPAMIAANQTWDASGGTVVATEPAPASDAAISAFVRRLAATRADSEPKPTCPFQHHLHTSRRVRLAWLARQRAAHRLQIAWSLRQRTAKHTAPRLNEVWVLSASAALSGDAPAIVMRTDIAPAVAPRVVIAPSADIGRRAVDPDPEPAASLAPDPVAAPVSPARCPFVPRHKPE